MSENAQRSLMLETIPAALAWTAGDGTEGSIAPTSLDAEGRARFTVTDLMEKLGGLSSDTVLRLEPLNGVIDPNAERLDQYTLPGGNLSYTFDSRELKVEEKTHFLPVTEAKVLESLLRRVNSIVEMEDLLLIVWDEYAATRNASGNIKNSSLRVMVHRLRKKLGELQSHIVGVQRSGYGFFEDETIIASGLVRTKTTG